MYWKKRKSCWMMNEKMYWRRVLVWMEKGGRYGMIGGELSLPIRGG